jgi:hypothetical protein
MDEDNEDVKRSGRVKFDDRGNAVWEWALSTGAFGRDVSTARLKTLGDHPSLSIVDEAPLPHSEAVPAIPPGTKKGYNPYDSTKLGKAPSPAKVQPARKKDLRRLGEWLKLKKQAEENKKRQEES